MSSSSRLAEVVLGKLIPKPSPCASQMQTRGGDQSCEKKTGRAGEKAPAPTGNVNVLLDRWSAAFVVHHVLMVARLHGLQLRLLLGRKQLEHFVLHTSL